MKVVVSGQYFTSAKDIEDFEEEFIIPSCKEGLARAYIRNCMITPRLYEKKTKKYKGFAFVNSMGVDSLDTEDSTKVDAKVAQGFEWFVGCIQPEHFMKPETLNHQKFSLVLNDLKTHYEMRARKIQEKQLAEAKLLASEQGISAKAAEMITNPEVAKTLEKLSGEGLLDDLVEMLEANKKKRVSA